MASLASGLRNKGLAADLPALEGAAAQSAPQQLNLSFESTLLNQISNQKPKHPNTRTHRLLSLRNRGQRSLKFRTFSCDRVNMSSPTTPAGLPIPTPARPAMVERSAWPAHPSNQLYRGNTNTSVDLPARHEFWTLKPGQKKVERKVDTRTANTEEFTIYAEDHTMGNMIRDALLEMPEVTFAAYKCPHPLDNRVIIRVQVNPESDVKPVDAFRTACEESIRKLEIFWQRFKQSYDLTKMSQENQAPANGS